MIHVFETGLASSMSCNLKIGERNEGALLAFLPVIDSFASAGPKQKARNEYI